MPMAPTRGERDRALDPEPVGPCAEHDTTNGRGQAEDREEQQAVAKIIAILAHDLRQPLRQAIDERSPRNRPTQKQIVSKALSRAKMVFKTADQPGPFGFF